MSQSGRPSRPPLPGLALIVLCVASFFLYAGYELVRSPSTVLFQAAYGIERLPIALTFVPVVVLLMLMGYSFMLSFFGPRRTLSGTLLLSSLMLVLCHALVARGYPIGRAILLVFAQSYIVLVTEQFWSYLDSGLVVKRARLWNPIFVGCGSVGAISGGWLVGGWAERIGSNDLILISALCLIPCAFLAEFAFKKGGEPLPDARKKPKRNLTEFLGLSLFRTSPALVRILTLVVASQAVSTVLGLGFQHQLQHAFAGNVNGQTAYSGKFYATLNLFTTFCQFVAAPLVLRYIQPAWIFLAIPVLHFCSGLALALHPSLAMASFALMMFKSVDYSFFRSTKEFLYIPLSFDARYRAKELIDTVGYRGSKGFTSMLIAIFERVGLGGLALYSGVAAAASLIWLCLAAPSCRKGPAALKRMPVINS